MNMDSDHIKITNKKVSSNKVSKKRTMNCTVNRSDLVAYAIQFDGNPYVYGGTSLTKGTDCSGFTQSVFRDKGINIPRTSRAQAAGGRTVSFEKMKPGDLLFYKKNGIINHVALYIGDGKVISASSPSKGIRITEYQYRKPCKAVSYID